MDAASNTGVDNMREITDSVRYAPVQARYKVYIIDEVHMLSKSAFNALLKTLEEPPPHVKFIFATTEINKVPVTILSRCQRFDLKRLDAALLASHYANIAVKEEIEAEPDALAMIARAAEGSDFDQQCPHSRYQHRDQRQRSRSDPDDHSGAQPVRQILDHGHGE